MTVQRSVVATVLRRGVVDRTIAVVLGTKGKPTSYDPRAQQHVYENMNLARPGTKSCVGQNPMKVSSEDLGVPDCATTGRRKASTPRILNADTRGLACSAQLRVAHGHETCLHVCCISLVAQLVF